MENKKENEIIKTIENKASEKVSEIEEQKETKLFIKREEFKATDGNQYYNYALYGKARGRDVKIDFVPKDSGGYEVLEIVFDKLNTAELVVKKEENTNSEGRKTRYNTYLVRNFDEEEQIYYECAVRPARDSDKALLKMVLRLQGIEIV